MLATNSGKKDNRKSRGERLIKVLKPLKIVAYFRGKNTLLKVIKYV